MYNFVYTMYRAVGKIFTKGGPTNTIEPWKFADFENFYSYET